MDFFSKVLPGLDDITRWVPVRMTATINGLIIDTNLFGVDDLKNSFQPEFCFETLEIVNTAHKAIQHHLEMDYEFCLISEQFPKEELKSFFNDFNKLDKPLRCVFVQLRENVSEDFERQSLANIGFDTIISKRGTKADKEALEIALKDYIDKKEYIEILGGLPDVVEYLMGEVDKIALEKKRGKEKDLNTIFSDHLKDSSQKYDGLRQDYLDKLFETTDKAKAFEEIIKLDIPVDVVNKNLPGLSKDGYIGQSHRVFNRLLNLHGAKKQK